VHVVQLQTPTPFLRRFRKTLSPPEAETALIAMHDGQTPLIVQHAIHLMSARSFNDSVKITLSTMTRPYVFFTMPSQHVADTYAASAYTHV